MTKSVLARHQEANIADQNRKAIAEHIEKLSSLIDTISTDRGWQGRTGGFHVDYVESVQDELMKLRYDFTRATVR